MVDQASIEKDRIMDEDYGVGMAMKPCLASDSIDWLVAVIWPLAFIVSYTLSDEYLLHWFVIPVYLCGVLVSVDAVRWCRGKMDTFDPRGLVGLFGCNFFVLSPILTAYYRSDMIANVYLYDVRPWLGGLAVLNFLGIMVYLYFERKVSQRPLFINKYWFENTSRSVVVLPFALLIIVFCYVFFLARGGGISSFLLYKTYGDVSAMAGTVGLGPLSVISRSLPIMLLITITVWFRKSGRQVTFATMAITVLAFLVVQFVVAGFTGSRAATMWGLFWAGGIMHFFWRPISVKLVICALIPLMVFSYLYGFYKAVGVKSFGIFTGEVSIRSLEYETKRTFAGFLVGDLGRSQVQAAILSIVADSERDYDFRYGTTYLTSAVSMIPRRIWPSKPERTGKVVAGTEMLYGRGFYQEDRGIDRGRRSTFIYGLAGEAMLNFGVWGVVPAFAVWGCVVGWIRRRVLSYPTGDMRLLIAPYLMLVGFFLLIQDLDNLFEVTVFNLAVPAFVIWLISFKAYRQNDELVSDYR